MMMLALISSLSGNCIATRNIRQFVIAALCTKGAKRLFFERNYKFRSTPRIKNRVYELGEANYNFLICT